MREVKGCWTDLFHTFMIALDIRKMSIAFVGLALSALVTAVPLFVLGLTQYQSAGVPVGPNPEGSKDITQDVKSWSGSMSTDDFKAVLGTGLRTAFPGVHLESITDSMKAPTWRASCHSLCDFFESCVARGPTEDANVFGGIPFSISQRTARWGSFAFFALLLSLIWSKFGGAITRIAAVEVAKDERIETQKALEYSSHKFGHYFWGPVACAIFFLVFFGCVFVVALAGRVPWLNVVVMLAFPLALLSGFIMILIVLGTIFGAPLFYPAISTEGTDSFDAISRGFSYFFSKPCHYFWYQIVALFFGVFSFAVVQFLGYLMLKATLVAGRLTFGHVLGFDYDHVLLGVWSGTPYSLPELHRLDTSLWLTAIFFNMWVGIFKGMLLAYGVAFFFSAQTMIYLLLRKQVDSIDMTEVFEEPEEEPPSMSAPAPAAPPAAPAAPPAAPKPV